MLVRALEPYYLSLFIFHGHIAVLLVWVTCVDHLNCGALGCRLTVRRFDGGVNLCGPARRVVILLFFLIHLSVIILGSKSTRILPRRVLCGQLLKDLKIFHVSVS